ncbi:ComF family protein [Homoserinibacter sp. GY 40078]|uniref:ComF family protein n=1 Tax=Homoserinibacter sp. GY 40078 TaxID=2603275 RepID=UPI00164F78CD|nr:phosphoribosyltransferase family protein [Homoserinibacter sp. GY 40078]
MDRALVAGLREAMRDALAIVSPVECAGCRAPDRELCGRCQRALAPEPVLVTTPGGLTVTAGAAYEGVVASVLLALKAGRTPLASALAPLLRSALAEIDADPRTPLCPVPSSRSAWRRRGFDPVRVVLARAGLEGVRALHPPAARPQQKTLDRAARSQNMVGAHRARGSFAGRRVLLVDDIVTTGATLDEAARAVRAAGAVVPAAVVIAATPLSAGTV